MYPPSSCIDRCGNGEPCDRSQCPLPEPAKAIEKPFTALNYLLELHNFRKAGFWSVDMPGKPASNTEVRRWLERGCLHINGRAVKADELLDYDFHSVVLFPKSPKRRCTLL